MKPIAINIKLLYQNREMWIWYTLFLISILMTFTFLPDAPSYFLNIIRKDDPFNNVILIKPAFVLIILGFAMGRLIAGIWNKPVLICLPGQIKTSLKLVLLTGLVFDTITIILITDLTLWINLSSLSKIIAFFSFYLMIYWISVILMLRFNESVFLLLFIYIVLFALPLMGRMELLISVQRFLFIHPWLAALICWVINCMGYYTLGSRNIARSLSGSKWVTFFTGNNATGLNIFRASHLIDTPYIERFEGFINRFFSDRIQANNRLLFISSILGRFYENFSYLIYNHLLILLINIAVFFCTINQFNHVQGLDTQLYYFALYGILGGHIFNLSRTDILLPISRRVKLLIGLTEIVTTMFFMLLIIAVFTFLSNLLTKIPNFTYHFFSLDLGEEYIPLNGRYIIISALIMPFISGLLSLFRKSIILSLSSVIILAIFLLIFNIYIINNYINIFEVFNSLSFVFILLLSFGFYFLTLYYDSIKKTR